MCLSSFSFQRLVFKNVQGGLLSPHNEYRRFPGIKSGRYSKDDGGRHRLSRRLHQVPQDRQPDPPRPVSLVLNNPAAELYRSGRRRIFFARAEYIPAAGHRRDTEDQARYLRDLLRRAPGVFLSCNDTVCSDCWIQYLKKQVVSDAKDQVSCPGAGCQMYLEDKVVLSFLSRNDQADKYKRIILDSCLESSYSLQQCAANCTNVFQSKVGDGSGVSCDCGKTFCFNCSSDWHAPVTCLHLKMWTKKCDDDSETTKWLNANTKDCPECRRVIMKDGGCNHMICKRCSYEFCWVCLGPWNEHGTSYYSCNRYDSSSSKDARAKVSNAQELETRYSFYCTRFNNHRQSTVIKEKLSDSLQHRMKYSFIHMQYVRRAFQVMYESRKVLMYTYPFAYYLDHSGHEVRIFESAQQHLEHDTEILGELLERRLKNEDDGKLKDLMQEVISKTNYVEQRMKALLKICEEGYVQRHWKFICE
ncbi:hypothetical protein L596_023724 [Steinernema carpocapsae]|uniref:RBR-type E3 ubiquitin transferase n=1 Tax=Steinernema carpocapsae TaxID=34508 RepID=A0A4V5ZZH7_STECR|nr:hypothetical protein L596_023724 [Steinernema carpocapsae]